MMVVALGAILAHVIEALSCIRVAKSKYKMENATVALWAVNVLFVGIFGK